MRYKCSDIYLLLGLNFLYCFSIYAFPVAHTSTEAIKNLKDQIFFTVAMDPTGPYIVDTPPELKSDLLTEQLLSTIEIIKKDFIQFSQCLEWEAFEKTFQEFLQYRKEKLYQKARTILKSGLLLHQLEALEKKTLTIEKERASLAQVNTPAPPIFQVEKPNNFPISESSTVVLSLICIGLFIFVLMLKKQKPIAKDPSNRNPLLPEGDVVFFDYEKWLKDFESIIEDAKKDETILQQKLTKAKSFTLKLKEAKIGFKIAKNSFDHEKNIGKLHIASEIIDDFLQDSAHFNFQKNNEKLIQLLLVLCNAIEKKKNFSLPNYLAK